MNKLLKTLATPFRAVGKMLESRRRTRKTHTRVTPAQRDASRRELDSHYRNVAASRRVAALPKRKHYGMGKKARAERKAIRDATRGYKLRSAYGSKRRGRKSRRGRKGRKTRRRGKRRTKSKK